MKSGWITVLAASLLACAPSAPTHPPEAPSASSDVDEPAVDEPAADELAADELAADDPTTDEPVVDEPVGEVPVVEGRWRPRLPTISLEPLSPDEAERGSGCIDPQAMTDPAFGPKDLMAAAVCLRDARHYGKEIAIYRLVLARSSNEPIAADALRTMGLRLEQMDNRSSALDAFEDYSSKYPKHKDARALGMRSVCLARTLGDMRREEEMLSALQRYFGRKGFVRPKPEQLPALCEEADAE